MNIVPRPILEPCRAHGHYPIILCSEEEGNEGWHFQETNHKGLNTPGHKWALECLGAFRRQALKRLAETIAGRICTSLSLSAFALSRDLIKAAAPQLQNIWRLGKERDRRGTINLLGHENRFHDISHLHHIKYNKSRGHLLFSRKHMNSVENKSFCS